MVRTLHFSGWMPLTMMFPIFLAYLDLIEAFLHLGLMKLSSMQLCRLRKVSLLMLSLLACHLYKKEISWDLGLSLGCSRFRRYLIGWLIFNNDRLASVWEEGLDPLTGLSTDAVVIYFMLKEAMDDLVEGFIKQSVCLPASMFRVMSSTNSINWVSHDRPFRNPCCSG